MCSTPFAISTLHGGISKDTHHIVVVGRVIQRHLFATSEAIHSTTHPLCVLREVCDRGGRVLWSWRLRCVNEKFAKREKRTDANLTDWKMSFDLLRPQIGVPSFYRILQYDGYEFIVTMVVMLVVRRTNEPMRKCDGVIDDIEDDFKNCSNDWLGFRERTDIAKCGDVFWHKTIDGVARAIHPRL